MAATTNRPDLLILRFDRVERAVHWLTAALFLTLVVTGAILYIGPLSLLVGRRPLVEAVHVYCGVALPVPLVVALAGRWGRGLREDIRRFNRWSGDDRIWLRASLSPRPVRHSRRQALTVGKFNAGQKLNAAFVAGTMVVMLMTGAVMRWYQPWPLSWRTGATFVHDWLALAATVVLAGHITYALAEPAALRSMIRGTISRRWAQGHAPGWLADTVAAPPDDVGRGEAGVRYQRRPPPE